MTTNRPLVMHRRRMLAWGGAALLLPAAGPASAAERVARAVEDTVRPLMVQHDLPGLAVGVTWRGARHLFAYGVASRATGQPVTDATLFEIGSVSKTFTALLGAVAAATGTLSLSDTADRHWPALRGSPIGDAKLRDLATYSAGGLPLQFPDAVADDAAMLAWLRAWKPGHAPGTVRQYSNPSIGLFGQLAARSLGEPFDTALQRHVLAPLGLQQTHLEVPQAQKAHYAFGHRDGREVRVTPGVLDAQAYGVKTTAADLLRFVESLMNASALRPPLRAAVDMVLSGYGEVGPMAQGLGWELYPAHAPLARLLAGNSTEMALQPQPVTALQPPRPPQAAHWVNKTGSTNGFGAYAAFVPARQAGVVLLANRNYPNAARVAAAHRILAALDGSGP